VRGSNTALAFELGRRLPNAPPRGERAGRLDRWLR
jgi:hypothetical protein